MPETRIILALDQATVTGFAHSAGYIGAWVLGSSRDKAVDKFAYLRSRLLQAHEQWPFDAIVHEDINIGQRHERAAHTHSTPPDFSPAAIAAELAHFDELRRVAGSAVLGKWARETMLPEMVWGLLARVEELKEVLRSINK